AASKVLKQPLDEAAKEWAKGFRDAASAVKFVEDLTGKLDPTVRHNIDTMIKAGHETQAVAATMDQLRERLLNIEGWAKQTSAIQQYLRAVGNLMEAGPDQIFGLSELYNLPQKLPGPAPSSSRSPNGLAPDFQSSLQRMIEDAAKQGITIGIG